MSRLDALLDRASVATFCCEWDAAKTLRTVSSAIESITGYAPASLIGSRYGLRNTVSGHPVFDGAGDFVGYRGVGRNIIARKRAEQALQGGDAKRAQSIDAAHKDLVRAETLAGQGFLVAVCEGYAIAEGSLHRAAELISGFKQLAADRTRAQRRKFDVAQLAQEVTITMAPQLRKASTVFVNKVAPGVVMDSYPGALGQVLTSLMSNSLVHAFEGRQSGEIQLRSDALGMDWLRMTYSDNGVGVAPQHIIVTSCAGRAYCGICVWFGCGRAMQTHRNSDLKPACSTESAQP